MGTAETSKIVNPREYLKYAYSTDVGLRRDENQDAYDILNHRGSAIYIVADGMGGTRGGAIASSMAVELVLNEIKKTKALDKDTIVNAVKHANSIVFEKSIKNPELSGMGTTLVGLIFKDETLHIVNVGDSRAYRIRDKRIKCITKDHTLVTELVRTGAITEDQADNHPVSHMLTRSLGPGPELDVDCWIYEYGPACNDFYLICSDGLYNQVSEAEIAEIVSSHSIDVAVEKLVKLANSRGGPDNITLILVQVDQSFPKTPEDYVDLSQEHDELPTLELEESLLEETARSLINSGLLEAQINDLEEDPHPERIQADFSKDSQISKTLLLPILFFGLTAGYFLATTSSTSSSKADLSKVEKVFSKAAQVSEKQVVETETKPNYEPEALYTKRDELKRDIAHIERSLEALEYATTEEKENFTEFAQGKQRSLTDNLTRINSELDESTRTLAKWYGRKKRLESKDGLNTATELAKEVTKLGAIKTELEGVTWEYLQAVELQGSSNSSRNPTELAKKRKDLVANLITSAISYSDDQIKSIQYKTAELTVQRENIERDLSALFREIEFAEIATSNDPRAKTQKRKLLHQERKKLEAELKEILRILEATSK
ncbi:MAG: Stp1/IreP family PP2C-type Ser/Thr phosphatase [Bdellovibrionota bacterium]